MLESGTLYVVATPIGNLSDISARALQILTAVDVIAAEDTRVTGQLLRHYGITTRCVSVREHNERQMAEQIVAWLQAGQSVAQVSDAGTPAISDPGMRLVDAVLNAGLRVSPIAGPSAVAAAISVSGLEGEGFRFVGFLPAKAKARSDALRNLRTDRSVLVFYEAPHRLLETLVAMREEFGGERLAVLARELSKTFETVHRAPLHQLAAWAESSNQARGECVLLVAPAADIAEVSSIEGERVLRLLLPELGPSRAVRLATAITGVNRAELYALALSLNADNDAEPS